MFSWKFMSWSFLRLKIGKCHFWRSKMSVNAYFWTFHTWYVTKSSTTLHSNHIKPIWNRTWSFFLEIKMKILNPHKRFNQSPNKIPGFKPAEMLFNPWTYEGKGDWGLNNTSASLRSKNLKKFTFMLIFFFLKLRKIYFLIFQKVYFYKI